MSVAGIVRNPASLHSNLDYFLFWRHIWESKRIEHILQKFLLICTYDYFTTTTKKESGTERDNYFS